MALYRNFKTDDSFLEKIAMGAIGTRKVFENLVQNGHAPIELERGSTNFKIWKAIKLKRIRVPDILCIRCGCRIECRAKSNLEISMSHSKADSDRGWDAGLNNEDVVALILCSKSGEGPTDWKASNLVQYVNIKDLRDAWNKGLVIEQSPKGPEEGFEVRVTWPAKIAKDHIKIESVLPDKVRYRYLNNNRNSRIISISLECQIKNNEQSNEKKRVVLNSLVSENDVLEPGRIIASVVPVKPHLPCSPNKNIIETYINWSKSKILANRYTAVKALSHFKESDVTALLLERMDDPDEHIYVRVEAAAGLMKLGDSKGEKFLRDVIDYDEYIENKLEAVIVLSEVATSNAYQILLNTLHDNKHHQEIRAGAAWALGEIGIATAIPSLIQSFSSFDDRVRIEAARALAKIARKHIKEVIESFPNSNPLQRPGIAWAISKAGGFSITDLIPTAVDDDAREWIAYIVGTQKKELMLAEIELLKEQDSEVYFAVNVLWKILESWICGLEEY